MNIKKLRSKINKCERMYNLFCDKKHRYMLRLNYETMTDEQLDIAVFKHQFSVKTEWWYDQMEKYDKIMTNKVINQIKREFNKPSNTLSYQEIVRKKMDELGWDYLEKHIIDPLWDKDIKE